MQNYNKFYTKEAKMRMKQLLKQRHYIRNQLVCKLPYEVLHKLYIDNRLTEYVDRTVDLMMIAASKYVAVGQRLKGHSFMYMHNLFEYILTRNRISCNQLIKHFDLQLEEPADYWLELYSYYYTQPVKTWRRIDVDINFY